MCYAPASCGAEEWQRGGNWGTAISAPPFRATSLHWTTQGARRGTVGGGKGDLPIWPPRQPAQRTTLVVRPSASGTGRPPGKTLPHRTLLPHRCWRVRGWHSSPKVGAAAAAWSGSSALGHATAVLLPSSSGTSPAPQDSPQEGIQRWPREQLAMPTCQGHTPHPTARAGQKAVTTRGTSPKAAAAARLGPKGLTRGGNSILP